MASYEIQYGSTNVIEIQLNSTFNNNDIVQINGGACQQIGSGTGPINITGDHSTYDFRIQITNLSGQFTLAKECFKNLNITAFTYPTPETQSFVFKQSAFQGSKLSAITLPLITNQLAFEDQVFQDCQNLVDFSFGNNTGTNFTEIPAGTFFGCTSLGNIIIPNYIVTMYGQVFYAAVLQSLTFQNPPSLVTIYPEGFSKTVVPQLIIPDSVTTIYDSAFSESQIPIITISDTSSLTTLMPYVFYESAIKSINLPLTLTHIGMNAFQDTQLTTLTIPNFSQYCQIDDGAFSGCLYLQTVNINGNVSNGPDPQNRDVLSQYMFTSCTNLTSVKLYDGLVQISANAFENCPNLNHVEFIGTTPLTLGDECFKNTGFDYLQIPSNVTTIGTGAFSDCSKLKQVVLEATNPSLTGDVFNNSTLMTQLILSKNFVNFGNADSFVVPNDTFRMYVFTPTQKAAILNYAKYAGVVLQYPYYNRNFINIKAIYDDEHEVGYVMYMLPSSNNTFNDCTFYFKEGSSTNPIVVIRESEDGVLTNCVKMYSATTDDGNKLIQKIYFDTESQIWNALLDNGTVKPILLIDQTYGLVDNFECPTVYTGQYIKLNGEQIKQCDMFNLSNLTQEGHVNIENLNKVELTSLRNNKTDQFNIVLSSTTGLQQFEVNDVNCAKLKLSGNNIITLTLENTIKSRQYEWSIEAPSIIINNLTINYTIFQNQQQGPGEANLTKIQCMASTYLIKFTADTVINFNTIQNKNNIFDPNSTDINAVYYVSGWTMM